MPDRTPRADDPREHNECQHCPHYTGGGVSFWSGGHSNVRCCHCGTFGTEEWHEEPRRMKGHGRYATETRRVVDRVVWTRLTIGTTDLGQGTTTVTIPSYVPPTPEGQQE